MIYRDEKEIGCTALDKAKEKKIETFFLLARSIAQI